MIGGLAKLHPEIVGPLGAYEKARVHLAAAIAAIEEAQGTCDHPQVLEADYEPLTYLSSLPALRMCAVCRVEEEGSVWSGKSVWSRDDHKSPALGNHPDRLVIAAKRDDIYALRLPGRRYLANPKTE